MSAKRVNDLFIMGFPIIFVVFILIMLIIVASRPTVTV